MPRRKSASRRKNSRRKVSRRRSKSRRSKSRRSRNTNNNNKKRIVGGTYDNYEYVRLPGETDAAELIHKEEERIEEQKEYDYYDSSIGWFTPRGNTFILARADERASRTIATCGARHNEHEAYAAIQNFANRRNNINPYIKTEFPGAAGGKK